MRTLSRVFVLSLLVGAHGYVSAQSYAPHAYGPAPFSTYDANGDGLISEQEFTTHREQRRALRASEGRPMRNAARAPAFSTFDANGDGQLTPQEHAAGQANWMQQRNQMRGPGRGQGPGMGRNMPSFAKFDLNGDGVLVEEEFTEARGQRIATRAKQGYMMRGLSNARPFSDIDADSDGKVTPDEFRAAQMAHRQGVAQ